MSDTVSLEFIGRRLDAVQVDTADIRRRMTRFEDRFDQIDRDLQGVKRGQSILEERMNALVERQSKLELTAARTLFLLQRLALKVGGIEDDAP